MLSLDADLPVIPDHVVPLLRPDHPLPPATVAWRPGDLSGLTEWIQRAPAAHRRGAVDLPGVQLAADGGEFMAQEKLNGCFVLWTGRDLFTKHGRRVDAPHFTRWLPPGVALVGEFYCGNGRRPFHTAVALCSNRLPTLLSLPPGTTEQERRMVWREARFVAFDVPGLEPPEEWPYHRRYNLLLTVVAAWSYRHREAWTVPSALPLQVIRQYPMSAVPDLFREVVEGRIAPRARRFPAFGIPSAAFADRGAAGRVCAAKIGEWLADAGAGGPDAGAGFRARDPVVPGEGLMLYRQRAPWIPRGAAPGQFCDGILKYKPTLVSFGAAVVGSDDTRVVRRRRPRLRPAAAAYDDDNDDDGAEEGGGGGADDAGGCSAPSVPVRWWDPWLGRMGHERIYRPKSRSTAAWREGSRIFFSFVYYDEGPRFTLFLGTDDLSPELRRRLCRRPPPGLAPDVPPSEWPNGTVAVLFPTHFDWDWMAFGHGLSDAERAQRVAPSPLILPDAGFSGGLGAIDRAMRDLRRREADRQERQTAAARASLQRVRRDWLNAPATYLGRALVCLCFVVRAWADRSGRTAAAAPVWWDAPALATGAVTMPAHPYARWGPFRLAPATGPPGSVSPWLHGMIRVLLTVLASVWIRINGQFGAAPLRGLTVPQGGAYLGQLEQTVQTMIAAELRPRWTAVMSDALLPPRFAAAADPFGPRNPGVLNLATVTEYLLRAAVDIGGGGDPADGTEPGAAAGAMPPPPPWALMWGGDGAAAGLPPEGIEIRAEEAHRWVREGGNENRLAAYRTFREHHLPDRWHPTPDDVFVAPETALPVPPSDLPDRVAARPARLRAPAESVGSEWTAQRLAGERRLSQLLPR
jgi:hypothetical protein